MRALIMLPAPTPRLPLLRTMPLRALMSHDAVCHFSLRSFEQRRYFSPLDCHTAAALYYMLLRHCHARDTIPRVANIITCYDVTLTLYVFDCFRYAIYFSACCHYGDAGVSPFFDYYAFFFLSPDAAFSPLTRFAAAAMPIAFADMIIDFRRHADFRQIFDFRRFFADARLLAFRRHCFRHCFRFDLRRFLRCRFAFSYITRFISLMLFFCFMPMPRH